ncbi:Alpha/Beta hydrolase protein [Echria macrotheca]|uniref:Carboxylic ester hydrolase n=1 Tax=Echria macrotheca TaxID=438768 RepID=A0AAJ0B8T4_9PEZI|nr:Alpha/Beta hydrolase protein [Echria macrotheca]
MVHSKSCLLALLGVSSVSAGIIPLNLHHARSNAAAPVVDLDYAQYQGVYNATFDVNMYRGIRYAAPPKRWQLPEAPVVNRTAVIQATDDPPRCPQSLPGPMPANFNFETNILGSEDCLFLNVFSPKNATKLPVVVWIHGGGYGAGSATSFDYSFISRTVNNSFVSVAIQYRLGAFGFLSSPDVVKHGTANAGVHDMRFGLQWVQKYISRFGGDPDQVTISGESAGGGSVMLMAIANGGNDGTSLFRRGIASSPYFPTQPNWDSPIVNDYYMQFARRAGCGGNGTDGVFACLEKADSRLLQNASAFTTYGARFGQWAFIPVTDGSLIKEQPNKQLLRGAVNGERMMAGNNANEATYFVPQNITTKAQFTSWLMLNYPTLTSDQLSSIMSLYGLPANYTAPSPRFDTDGLHPPYATTLSAYASGWQQAANNLYAETTFVCPAYWLADAYSPPVTKSESTKKAWRYQFSIPNAFHGSDVTPLITDPDSSTRIYDASFKRAFQRVWGGFVVNGDPTIPSSLLSTEAYAGDVSAAAAKTWEAWGTGGKYELLNVNVTGQPAKAKWNVADALAWEGGRGERCALWGKIGLPF